MEFINQLDLRNKKTIQENIDEMKSKGLPIEDA